MKNNPCETGLVYLEDLSQNEIFVGLKEEIFNDLDIKIRAYGIAKFSKKLGVSKRIITHWLSEDSLIRLDILRFIFEFFSIKEYTQYINFLRGKDRSKIYNPKIPFNFNSLSGVRIIAGILGDGGISANKQNPYYTNSDKNLINSFIKDINFVFGDLEFNSREMISYTSTITTILEFPSLIQKVFLRIGLKPGKKVETNQNIPSFIFDLGEKEKFSFITQFFDDEGCVNILAKHITFTSSCLERYESSNLLKDIQKLLLSLDIGSSIYMNKIYSSSRGEDRKIYNLQINGQFQLKKLYDNLDLKILKKKEKFRLLLQSIKLRVFRKKEWLSIYLKFINDIESSKGYFTSLDISQKSGMTIGSCRNIIIKFKKQNLIKCIRSYTSGNYHEYGRYMLIKNG